MPTTVQRLTFDHYGRIVLPDSKYPKVRLMIGDERAVVWREAAGTLERVADAPIAGFERKGRTWEVTTESGDVWRFTKQGCGCGRNALKKLRREEAFG